MRLKNRSTRAAAAILIMIVMTGLSGAGDLSNEPYLLRLDAALRRPTTGFSAAAALQATAAHPAGFSINPAADDVLQDPMGSADINSTFTHLNTFSESSAWLTDTAVTSSISFPGRGTLSLAYARTDTIETKTKQDLDNALRSNEFFWGYSKRLSDDLAIGIQTRFLTAAIQSEEVGQDVPIPLRFDTDILWGVRANVGIRWACSRRWAFGVTGVVGDNRTTTDVTNVVAIPDPAASTGVIPPDTLLTSFDGGFRTRLVRAGLGFTPTNTIGFYLDGEYYRIESDQDSIDLGRALFGMEYRPCRHRALFLGGSLDKFAEYTFSTGFRRAICDQMNFVMSFQHNAFPEVKQEFGRFDQVTISLEIR